MRRNVLPLAACALLAGCSGWQSALDPHSAEAMHLADLFWVFVAVNAVVWVLVAAALAFTLVRKVRGDAP